MRWSEVLLASLQRNPVDAKMQLASAEAMLDALKQGLIANARIVSRFAVDHQTKEFDPIRQTDPTHAQLAKDHEDHPLHELAVTLAKMAVRDVGIAIKRVWQGEAPVQSLIEVAAQHFDYPSFDQVGRRPYFMAVDEWARENASRLKDLEAGPIIRARFEAQARARADVLRRLDLLSPPGTRAATRNRAVQGFLEKSLPQSGR